MLPETSISNQKWALTSVHGNQTKLTEDPSDTQIPEQETCREKMWVVSWLKSC